VLCDTLITEQTAASQGDTMSNVDLNAKEGISVEGDTTGGTSTCTVTATSAHTLAVYAPGYMA
jgi:hypothetical protein